MTRSVICLVSAALVLLGGSVAFGDLLYSAGSGFSIEFGGTTHTNVLPLSGFGFSTNVGEPGLLFADQPYPIISNFSAIPGTILTASAGSPGFADFVGLLTDGKPESLWLGMGDSVDGLVWATGGLEAGVLYRNSDDPRVDLQGCIIQNVQLKVFQAQLSITPSGNDVVSGSIEIDISGTRPIPEPSFASRLFPLLLFRRRRFWR